jgi:hypothetical protein
LAASVEVIAAVTICFGSVSLGPAVLPPQAAMGRHHIKAITAAVTMRIVRIAR